MKKTMNWNSRESALNLRVSTTSVPPEAGPAVVLTLMIARVLHAGFGMVVKSIGTDRLKNLVFRDAEIFEGCTPEYEKAGSLIVRSKIGNPVTVKSSLVHVMAFELTRLN